MSVLHWLQIVQIFVEDHQINTLISIVMHVGSEKILYFSVSQIFADGSGLGQAQIYGGEKPVNGIQPHSFFYMCDHSATLVFVAGYKSG